jgi:hypothetical protein
MKIETTDQGVKSHLLEQLRAAGGIAELMQRRNFDMLFYFADRPVGNSDFVSGKGMSSSQCDKQLETFIREQKDLLGIFQNSWSRIGDLDEIDASAAGTFVYQGQYYHFLKNPSLSIADCRRVSVTQFGAIFLVAQPLGFRDALSSRTKTRDVSAVDADAVARATRFVFVPAFDGESWLGAATAK